MDNIISISLAQQIVDSVKHIVGKDINIINQKGIIIASTDSSRIGTFHEAGFSVINSSSSKIVEDEQTYTGSKKGINYPIRVNDKTVAVIGITGNPSELNKYGFLITKITEVFIKEQQLEYQYKTRQQLIRYAITSLISNDPSDSRKLIEILNMDSQTKYAVMVLYHNSNSHSENLSSIDAPLEGIFHQFDSILHTYIYPNEYIALLDESQYRTIMKNCKDFEHHYGSYLKTGIGPLESISCLPASYHYAKLALDFAVKNKQTLVFYEKNDLFLLLECMDDKIKAYYSDKILSKLDLEEIKFLKVYFQNNTSLKETANKLFLHPNTVQYRLNKIAEKTSLDARSFHDAVLFYLAINFI